ncbi:AI-2E family transporter [Auraticoccus monumenti]|uniref:Predicted PurR-regulated permease PerM n=1 Tax=Auraticoccus monumenti TaxID=675864 RepID=A0A1G6ZQV9_9ACTN|nr:AI-2E family transporter [Auraticoccus monumenti]SDE05078.1 Predicted PurR-regulated permease PerM [Auraticoccus monumenti]
MVSNRHHRAAVKSALKKVALEQEALRAAAADPAVLEARAATPREERTGDFERAVPFGVRVAAGWSWRLAVIAAGVYGIGWVLMYFSEVTVPIAVALLLAALLQPLIERLTAAGCPKGLAVAIGVVGGFLVVVGVLTLIVQQIVQSSGELGRQAVAGAEEILQSTQNWLENGPVPVDTAQLSNLQDQLAGWAAGSTGVIAGWATAAGGAIGHFFAGLAIALFTLFFLLYDGNRIWNAVLRLVPIKARERADVAARTGWQSLISYVRATVLVALVDAVGVLLVALFLGVPLAPALAALVFLGAFVPIVGALVTGFVAVAVALVALGWVPALIMLVGIIAVMQLEGHVLQPFLLGKAVSVHPLAVILSIAVGITLGGVVGGLIAIPLLAFTQSFVTTLNRGGQFGQLQLPEPPEPEPEPEPSAV